MDAHLLFSGHHVLVAWTENLIDLGDRSGAISHCADGLNATSLEDLADTCNAGSHEDGGIHLTVATWRRAEHNLLTASDLSGSDLLTTSNLCGCGQHEDGREEWGSTTWDIETYLLDGDALLPTGNARLRLYLLPTKLLGFVEGLDVMLGHHDGCFQLCADQLFGFVHLGLANGEVRQIYMVELKFVAFHGIIATTFYIGQDGGDSLIELRHI